MKFISFAMQNNGFDIHKIRIQNDRIQILEIETGEKEKKTGISKIDDIQLWCL